MSAITSPSNHEFTMTLAISVCIRKGFGYLRYMKEQVELEPERVLAKMYQAALELPKKS